jgi:hypothetical protein
MSPLIEAHDKIIAGSARHHAFPRGALIVFRDGENLIVHRIIGKKAQDGHGLLCQMGDNSSTYSWVREQDVLGRVLAIEKGLKFIPLDGPMALLAGSGIRLIGWAFIRSDQFLNGVQKTWGGETPGPVLRGFRRFAAAAHHWTCHTLSASFLWIRRNSDPSRKSRTGRS